MSGISNKVIADSSDIESDFEDEIRVSRKLRAVEIPAMSPVDTSNKPPIKTMGSNSPTDTTTASMDGSTRATSLETDTPGTTPAHSIAAASVKRKRSALNNVVKMEESMDEELARHLQEEEYNAVAGASKRTKLSRSEQVADTEDDESELSELESIGSLSIKAGESPFAAGRKRSNRGAQQTSRSRNTIKLEADDAMQSDVSDADSDDVPLVFRRPQRPGAQNRNQTGKSLPSRIAGNNARASLSTNQKRTTKNAEPELEAAGIKSDSSEYDWSDPTTGVSDTESTASELLPTLTRPTAKSRRRRPAGNTPATNDEEIPAGLTGRKRRERKKL